AILRINERVCLVGRNGAGKSTLMKILNREQGLDDGRIIYEQDLIVARLQQDPPRNVEGSVSGIPLVLQCLRQRNHKRC
ncbi:ATP-binding cassette domain-containing protein, partial [Escherichia sp. R-CC3]